MARKQHTLPVPDARQTAAAHKHIEKFVRVIKPDAPGFLAYSLEMPGIIGRGRTAVSAIEQLNALLAHAVAMLLADGQTPPAPASDRKLEQINVRITAEEKLLLRELIQRAQPGLSASDFVRAALRSRLGLASA